MGKGKFETWDKVITMPRWMQKVLPEELHQIDSWSKADEFLSAYIFPFAAPKQIKVKMWQIGLLHRCLQTAVIVFMAISHYSENTWARSETPIASVNAYHVAGGYRAAVNVTDYEATYPYCKDWQLNLYKEDDYYNYDAPQCLLHSEDEIVQKASGKIQYTTAYIQKIEYGWPCGPNTMPYSVETNNKIAKCNAGAAAGNGGEIETLLDGQCFCTVRKMVYPVGVEEFDLAFSHKVAVVTPVFRKGLGDLEIQETKFEKTNGEDVIGSRPNFLQLPLKEFIASYDNMALDDYNTDVTPDVDGCRGSHGCTPSPGTSPAPGNCQCYPYRRTTGVHLKMTIEYSNLEGGRVRLANNKVKAAVKFDGKDATAWAGWGAKAWFEEYPTGEWGNQEYIKVTRYRQGVVVEFQVKGQLYLADPMYLLLEVVATIVLLGACATVTSWVAFFMIPHGISATLYTKRTEWVNRKEVFAEMGAKAAANVIIFQALDREKTGRLSFKDLTRIFADVPDIGFEKATQIAKSILADAAADPTQGLTFKEFVDTLEGSNLGFNTYLKYVKRGAKGVNVGNQTAGGGVLAGLFGNTTTRNQPVEMGARGKAGSETSMPTTNV